MTDRDEREALARASAADAVLQHPLINEALDAYELELTKAWQNSPQKAVEDREALKAMHTAARHFRDYLQTVKDTGALIKARPLPSTIQRLRKATGL